MKKGILFLGMLCLSVAALGFQESGASPRFLNSFAPLNNYLQGGTAELNTRYLLPKMIKGETLRIGLLVREDYEPELTLEEIKEMIASSYQQWFEETAVWIRHRHREAEFADILKVLDQGVKVEFVEENPDIEFYIQSLQELQAHKGFMGYYTQEFGDVQIWLAGDVTPSEEIANASKKSASFFKALATHAQMRWNFYKHAALHEIGHSVAFADMYVQGRLNSDQIYGSVKPSADIPSVMDSITPKSIKQEPHLSCDDATGMINLIDITCGYTERGGEKGWKSLCPKSKEYFIHNISGLKDSYRVQLIKGKKVLIGTYKGKAILREYPFADKMITPFEGISISNDVRKEKPERDALGRLVHGKTVKSDELYVNYLYERRIMAVINSKSQAVYFRMDDTLKNKRKSLWIFNQNGEMNELEITREEDAISLNFKKGTVDSEDRWVQVTDSVTRHYDKKGNPDNSMGKERERMHLPMAAAQEDELAHRVQNQAEQEKYRQFDDLVKRWIKEKIQ